MLPATSNIADTYWARNVGCSVEELRPRMPHVRAQAGDLMGYEGIFILQFGAAPLVSVPPELVPELFPSAAEFTLEAVSDRERIRQLLAPCAVTRVIGPALLCYADESCFRPPPLEGARALTASDAAAFAMLKARCVPEECEAKEFDLESGNTFGDLDASGALRAVANFHIWSDRIAHIGVITDAEARGRGHASRAVGVATQEALRVGLVPQYRVLSDNLASRRVAAKLGFEEHGWSVAARLKSQPRS